MPQGQMPRKYWGNILGVLGEHWRIIGKYWGSIEGVLGGYWGVLGSIGGVLEEYWDVLEEY